LQIFAGKKRKPYRSNSEITEKSSLKKIIFQGKEEKLKKIINKDLRYLINSNILSQLLEKPENFKIGNPVPISKDFSETFYIEHFFYPIIIESDIENSTDFIVLKGSIKKEKIRKEKKKKDVIVISDQIKDFQSACQNEVFEGRSMHWIKKESCQCKNFWCIGKFEDMLVLKQTVGSVLKIMEKIVPRKKEIKCNFFTEDDMINQLEDKKIVIISDTAGMGKSTLFTSLSLKIKNRENDICHWVIRLDLNNHSSMLKKRKEQNPDKFDIDSAVDFLKKMVYGKIKKESFEQNLFEASLLKSGKIVILLDGFDEISPYYSDVVINLITELSKTQAKKVFVSTRPNMKSELEENLDSISRHLKPLTKKEQEDYLTNYWTSKFGDKSKDKIETYVQAILAKMSKSLSDREKKFTGILLQINLLADAFETSVDATDWEGCKEFLKSKADKPKLPDKLHLADLYDLFVKRKFDIFLEDKIYVDLSRFPIKYYNILYKIFLEEHGKLALVRMFSEDDVKKLLPESEKSIKELMEEIQIGKERSGLVDQVSDGKPQFIHLTFAEYFVAKFFVTKIADEDESNKTLIEFFCKKLLSSLSKFEVVRAFIESIVKKMDENKQSNLALMKCGDFLLEFFKETNEKNVDMGREEDDDEFYLKWSLNDYLSKAIRDGNKKTLKSTFYHLKDKIVKGKSLLHYAVDERNAELVKVLSEIGANVNVKTDKDRRTPLHAAILYCLYDFCYENFDFFLQTLSCLVKNKYAFYIEDNTFSLLEKICNIFTKVKNAKKLNLFQKVGLLGDAKILKHFEEVELAGKCVDSKLVREYHKTAYLLAAKSEIADTCNPMDCDSIILGPRMEDIQERNFIQCKWLCENGADIKASDANGNSALHLAALSNNLELCEWLIKNGLSVNDVNEKQQTPLHYAVLHKILIQIEESDNWNKEEICDVLLSAGANLMANFVNRGGEKLVWMAMSDNLEPCKKLIELFIHKYVKCKVWSSSTYSKDDICYLFLENGADINKKDKNGNTALHFAALSGNEELCQILIEKGEESIIMITNKNNETPLQSALAKKKETYNFIIRYYVNNNDFVRKNITLKEFILSHHSIPKRLVDEKEQIERKQTQFNIIFEDNLGFEWNFKKNIWTETVIKTKHSLSELPQNVLLMSIGSNSKKSYTSSLLKAEVMFETSHILFCNFRVKSQLKIEEKINLRKIFEKLRETSISKISSELSEDEYDFRIYYQSCYREALDGRKYTMLYSSSSDELNLSELPENLSGMKLSDSRKSEKAKIGDVLECNKCHFEVVASQVWSELFNHKFEAENYETALINDSEWSATLNYP